MAATNTAPAATSFAIFASGSKLCVATSTAASTAVLMSSVTITKLTAKTTARNSVRPIRKKREAPSTAAVAAAWIRMLRWVRNA